MGRVIRIAWLSSVRQPARTGLGVLGVIAVGALLFDMLLLSRGLVLSFGNLLDREGFDVRVLATDATPLSGPVIERASAIAAAIRALPQVEAAAPVRIADADVALEPDLEAGAVETGAASVSAALPGGAEAARTARDRTADHAGGGRSADVTDRDRLQFIGADPQARPMWTILQGQDLASQAGSTRPLLVNRTFATEQHLAPGSVIRLRASCSTPDIAAPPLAFSVIAIAEFPFDDAAARTVAGRLADLRQLCGGRDDDRADMLLVKSRPPGDADAAAAAIRALRPDLHVVTNEQIIERFSRVEFSYFQQISFVLSTLTLFFGFLLIAVLLTVSVNQRLGEIAALRAIGLSRGRVMAGVLCESAIVVGAGGVLAVPAGLVLSVWLDGILRALPGIPTSVSFFVFEPRTIVFYGALLGLAATAAAVYPMRIVGTLPIAGTLRREAVS
jgi:putative ABC transport system permease protein